MIQPSRRTHSVSDREIHPPGLPDAEAATANPRANLDESNLDPEQLKQQLQQEMAKRQRAEVALQQLQRQVKDSLEAERQRTQAALQQQIERERLVAQIAQHIRQSLRLDDILHTTVEEVRQFLQTDRVIVFQFETASKGRVVMESVAPDWTPICSTTIHDACLAEDYAEFFRQGNFTAHSDIYQSELSPCHIDLLAHFQVRANLVVPILQGEHLWGLLIAHHCADSRQWLSLEIDWLKQLATQVGIGIQQAELYRQLQIELAERKRAEAELRHNHDRLALAFDAAKMGSWDWDMVTQDLLWTPYHELIFGYQPGMTYRTYRDWSDRVHPEDLPRLEALTQEVIANQQDYDCEYRILWEDGSLHWVSAFGRFQYDGEGRPVRMVGMVQDITERKQAELEIRQMSNALSNAIEGISRLDAEGRYILVNDAYARTVGYEREEMIGMDWRKTVHPDDLPILQAAYVETIETGKVVVEARGIRRDGSLFYKELFMVAIYDEQQQFVGHHCFMKDVSDRRLAEQKIREQAALLDVTTDAITVRDLDNRILFWNQGAERLYGWTAAEVLGQDANDLLYRERPLTDQAIKMLFATGAWQGELQQTTKAGSEITVASRWTLVRDTDINHPLDQKGTGQPKAILVVSTDITEKKQLERQFLRTQRMESIGTLASGVAHDLNNVLTPILAGAQLLLLKHPDADEQTRELLKLLEVNAKRGSSVIKQVLSFARGMEGKHTLLQIKSLLQEINQMAQRTFPKSIEIRTGLPQNLWLVSGDPTQLHQVLMNLCINARDAMPCGGTLKLEAENLQIDEVTAWMEPDAQVGSYVRISVSDTGTGIAAADLDRIFEPFFTTKEVGKGTGLGLSTAMGILKSHGGFITVSSQINQGTQFQVYLPAVRTALSQSFDRDVALPQGRHETILVVDDEAPIREVTRATLIAHGYRVLTADNGKTAIAQFIEHQSKISLVLTDIMMPVMDGRSLIQSLRAMNPQVKVIAFSGLISNDKLAVTTEVDAFLAKPYSTEDLLNLIRQTLDRACRNL